MNVESSVTSLSSIPSEPIHGIPRVPFETGILSYDDPPPDQLDDIQALTHAGRFRFLSHQRVLAEVEARTAAVAAADTFAEPLCVRRLVPSGQAEREWVAEPEPVHWGTVAPTGARRKGTPPLLGRHRSGMCRCLHEGV